MASRAEITTKYAKAYTRSSKRDNGLILDQVVEAWFPRIVETSLCGFPVGGRGVLVTDGADR